MRDRDTLRAELDALAAEIRGRPAATGPSSAERRATSEAPPGPDPRPEAPHVDPETTMAELAGVLDDLRAKLGDGVAGTRGFTAANPVAALAAAFLVGIVVGRLWRSA